MPCYPSSVFFTHEDGSLSLYSCLGSLCVCCRNKGQQTRGLNSSGGCRPRVSVWLGLISVEGCGGKVSARSLPLASRWHLFGVFKWQTSSSHRDTAPLLDQGLPADLIISTIISIKTLFPSWADFLMPVMPVLRQEDGKFHTNQDDTEESCLETKKHPPINPIKIRKKKQTKYFIPKYSEVPGLRTSTYIF